MINYASFSPRLTRLAALLTLNFIFGMLLPLPAAAEEVKRAFNIPEGDALVTLKQFVAQSRAQLLYSADAVDAVRTNGIKGDYTSAVALERLLAGTNLTVTKEGEGEVFTIRSKSKDAQAGRAGIFGRVRNESTGAYLQGAEVAVIGLPSKTLTERDGSFTLKQLPAGDHTVRVSYTGLDTYDQVVKVVAGETRTLEIGLTESVYQLSALTVVGAKEGNAVSITRQKNSDNIVNVISTDAYGNVADGNIGNFMQRLPGVSAIYAEGEIIGIGLRGIPPNQSAVTVDGSLMTAAVAGSAASVQGDRAPPIDRLPAEFIKEIEVFKAPTPDRPVNGLGGSANLITKSAFDFKTRVFAYRLGMTQNLYRSGSPSKPAASFTYMDVLDKDRRLAFTFSGSYTQTVNARDRVQGQHIDTDLRSTQARLLDDTYDRVRSGYAAKVEYKLTPSTLVGASILYSKYSSDTTRFNVQANDTGSRRVADYSVVSRAQILSGAQPRTTTNQTASIAPGFTDTYTEMIYANWANLSATEIRRGNQYKYELNGSTEVGETKITALANFSPAVYNNNYSGFTSTLPRVGVSIDAQDTYRPVFVQTYGPSIFADTDFKGYTADYFQQPDRTEETITSVKIDAERKFETKFPFDLKMGLMWSDQDRKTDTWRPTWAYTGPDGVKGLNGVTGINDDNLAQFAYASANDGLFRGAYQQFRFLDFDKIQTAFRNNPSWFSANANVATRAPTTKVSEKVSAGYVMGRLKVDRLQVVGGVRTELTDVAAVGQLVDPQNPASNTVSVGRDYEQVFPSLHLRYELHKNLLLRASFSTSMARPTISQITPNTTVNYVTESVSQGNPALLPQYSKNYDFSAEYYFEPAGVLSLSVYQKDISDYIFTQTSTIGAGSDNGFNGSFSGFDFVTSRNGGQTKIQGVEVNYMQRLVFLPHPLNGLVVFANYTDLTTKGTFDDGQTELANFIPQTANAGFSYDWKKIQVRTALNYQSANLFTYNANALQRQYRSAVSTVDVNLQYTVRPWLSVFADFTNIFNKWPNIYYGNDERRMFVGEVFGSRISVGVRGRF